MPAPGVPQTSLRRPQWGIESTYGTSVAATRMFNFVEGSIIPLQPEQSKSRGGLAGLKGETREELVTELSKLSIKGKLDYQDIKYLLASCIDVPVESELAGAANEVQTVTINGVPTGGTFTLTFLGQTTAGIAYNAIASAVQTALQALSTIGASNATVSGSAGGPYTVTFAAALANMAQPLMIGNGASLTGGTNPSIAVARATPGQTLMQSVFESSIIGNDLPQSYTLEWAGNLGSIGNGGNDRALKAVGVLFDGFKISTARDKALEFDTTGFAKAIQDAISASVGQNCIQQVYVNGGPTGGTFQLIVDNQATSALSYNATAAQVQTALQALNSNYSGNIAVVGQAGGPYSVVFAGSAFPAGLAGFPMPLMSANYAGLTGGSSPTVTVLMAQQGGMKINAVNGVQAGDLSIAWATTLAGLDNAPLYFINEFKTDFDLPARLAPVWRQNTTDVGYGTFAEKKASEQKPMLSLCFAYLSNAQAVAYTPNDQQLTTFLANSRSGAGMYFRLKWTQGGQSPITIGSTGVSRSITLDIFGVPTFKQLEDEQGNVLSSSLDVNAIIDMAGNFWYRWTVVTDGPSAVAA